MPNLETPRLHLRPWAESDAEILHEAFGDAETMRFWDSELQSDVAETETYIRASLAVDPRFHAAFAVTSRETGQPVGMINYHDRRPGFRRLAVGWILIPSRRRLGFMREAMPAFLTYCFDRLDTHRVEAHIEEDNKPSVRLAEWLGFQREGLLRDWMFVSGGPRSVHTYGLLKPDWDHVSNTSNP